MRRTVVGLFVKKYFQDDFSSAQRFLSYFSNQQCILFLCTCLIYVEHLKQAEKENCQCKNDFSNKDHRICKINKLNTPILNWLQFCMLFSENSTSVWQSIPVERKFFGIKIVNTHRMFRINNSFCDISYRTQCIFNLSLTRSRRSALKEKCGTTSEHHHCVCVQPWMDC